MAPVKGVKQKKKGGVGREEGRKAGKEKQKPCL